MSAHRHPMTTEALIAERRTTIGGVADTNIFQYEDAETGVVSEIKPVCVLGEESNMAVAVLLTTTVAGIEPFSLMLFNKVDMAPLDLVTPVYFFFTPDSDAFAWIQSNLWYGSFYRFVLKAFGSLHADSREVSALFDAAIQDKAFVLRDGALAKL